ncbi:MAG: hypothetical protein ACP5IJ_02640 [Candidatus Nanoarchaeia archaeon]
MANEIRPNENKSNGQKAISKINGEFERVKAAVKLLLERNPELAESASLLLLYFWYFYDDFPILLPKYRATRLVDPELILAAKKELENEFSESFG